MKKLSPCYNCGKLVDELLNSLCIDCLEKEMCPKCGVDWESDCDSFGCWKCGYVKKNKL